MRLLGRGNNGAAFTGPRGTVLKWTVDPVEISVALAVLALRDDGYALPGAPQIHAVHLGERAAVIQREDIVAPPTREHLFRFDPVSQERLQRGSRMLAAGRVSNDSRLITRGRRAIQDGLASANLPHVRDVITATQERFGVSPLDIRPENMGRALHRGQHPILHDLGRAPLETLTVSRGEAFRRCPNEAKLTTAIKLLLGVPPIYGACGITNGTELRAVMQKHGWADAEIDGTIGFHTDEKCSGLFRKHCRPGDVLLLEGHEASILHEMVHAAGVVDKFIAVWLCEAITEATAQDIASVINVPQYPTYPQEVGALRNIVLPAMVHANMLPPAPSPVATHAMRLAHGMVRHPQATCTTITKALAARYGRTPAAWYAVVGPAGTSVADFEGMVKRAKYALRETR